MAGIPAESMNATIAAAMKANMLRSCKGSDITASLIGDGTRSRLRAMGFHAAALRLFLRLRSQLFRRHIGEDHPLSQRQARLITHTIFDTGAAIRKGVETLYRLIPLV
jgi:hypothetical protein